MTASHLQEAIETAEALSPDNQTLLLEVVQHRLAQSRRAEIVDEVAMARTDYQRGQVRRGDTTDLTRDLPADNDAYDNVY